MVDDREFLKQYSYKATSNLVLEQDRSSRRERNADTGEVVPLRADDLPGRMGDKARSPDDKPAELKKLSQKRDKLSAGSSIAAGRESNGMKRLRANRSDGTGINLENLAQDMNVVDIANELELDSGLGGYVPTTLISQSAFEALLSFVMSKLGDQPRDLLRGAAEEAVAVLKDERLNEAERKKLIDEMLAARMSVEEFSRLSALGRQIDDFGENAMGKEQEDGEKDYDIDGRQGVAVLFGDEDEDDQDVAMNYEIDEVLDVRDGMDEAEVDRYRIGSGNSVDDVPASASIGNMETVLDSGRFPDDKFAFNPRDVDAYWLQRQLSEYYKDADRCQQLAEEVLSILSSREDDRTCEKRLVMLLEFDRFDFISAVLRNREAVVYGTKLARSKSPNERAAIELEMGTTAKGLGVLQMLRLEGDVLGRQVSDRDAVVEEPGKDLANESRAARQQTKSSARDNRSFPVTEKPKFPLRSLDLENLSFQKGGRLLPARDCQLPEGSEHIEKKDYEEWHIPAIRAVTASKELSLIPIKSLPEWARLAFPNMQSLNRVQSSVYPCAYQSDENMLLCAPTGAGKTNVAVLTILRAVQSSVLHGKEVSNLDQVDYTSFKAIYVAPMKALVTEVVENLGRRLGSLGMEVRELTGDVNLSRHEIDQTQIIVTTPEKWDIITRKSGERAFTNLVRLLIIDEVHLLHDERGPVLEAIVARTSRNVEAMTATTRVIALSATLPNYKDVAAFLRVDPEKGLFYFDSSHRPCALQQCYVGITAKKALKRFQLINELTYSKVKQQLEASNQVIVFVHSRKETAGTGHYLLNQALDDEATDLFMKPGGSYEVVQAELPNIDGKDLRTLLEQGIAIHHAGMTRTDRTVVEDLFEAGHIKVLVSTATLAWGVNLPAHAVIIKGTQVYSPEHGRWIELSPMDVMQMMGRAGRPQFDTYGEGIIITTKANVLFYLSLLNHQMPIESQFVSRLVNMLNAEVAMGSVSSIDEGSTWLCYTYLYVRMLSNPILYGIPAGEHQADARLERRRAELVHAASRRLHQAGLVVYDAKSGMISSTELGRVAANFYVSHETMSVYVKHMKPSTSDLDLFRIFSLSGEFRHMRVRAEEKLELTKLAERVPIPIKEPLDEPSAKVNVLVQAYISNLSLDGLALKADMVHVSQSAARLTRAMLQVAIRMKCASLVEKCLSFCKNISTRQWASQTPLRQFWGALESDVLHKIERKDIGFERYYDLTVSELGELLRDPKLGRKVHKLVHSLPRLELDARVRPLTRSILEVDLTLTPDFRFDGNIHGSGESFWIFVEDADSEHLLYTEPFFLRRSLASKEHFISFTIPLSTPTPPQYFIKCVSDRWIVPETVLPVSFRGLHLPEKFSLHTKPLDLRPLAITSAFADTNIVSLDDAAVDHTALQEGLEALRTYFGKSFNHFSPLQTQLFQSLFNDEANAVVATLPNVDRAICAELSIARLFCRNPTAVAVWIVGRGDIAVEGVQRKLANGIAKHLELNVVSFLSDRSADIKNLRQAGSVIVTTGQRWDMFSRKWRQKREGKIIRSIGLLVVDGIHMVGQEQDGKGAALEIAVSRMRCIATDMTEGGDKAFRIICLSDPIANAEEIGHWIGAPPSTVFTFHPRELNNNIRIELSDGLPRTAGEQYSAATLGRPVFNAIRKHVGNERTSVLVYAPSRKMSRSLAREVLDIAAQRGDPKQFVSTTIMQDIEIDRISTGPLKECVALGVGYIHPETNAAEAHAVEKLLSCGAIQVLVTTVNYSWQTHPARPSLVVIAGTAQEDIGGLAVRRCEYPRTDLMRMVCSGSYSLTQKAVAVIITDSALREHYKFYCSEPAPVESQLREALSDHMNAEIAAGVVETKQDAVDYLSWTFFFRRLPKNPNYYGMSTVSRIGISNYLSELIEGVLSDLEASKCVAAEGQEDIALGALNLGIIASHYYIRHSTVELFASVTPKTKLRGLLDILSLASEFNQVPMRVGEEQTLMRYSRALPIKTADEPQLLSSSHLKTHVLLQAQLCRLELTSDLSRDQARILPVAMRLLRALVDVASSAGWLKPALAAIDLSQMLTQGLCENDSPLLQLPHISKAMASNLQDSHDVSDIFGFLDIDPMVRRNDVLGSLSDRQVLEVASVCQRYPDLDNIEIQSLTHTHENDLETVKIVVRVARNLEEGEAQTSVPIVAAARYPELKEEGWWVIVGDLETNSVLTLKHILLKKESVVKLEFSSALLEGSHKFRLYLLSDSYFDCDQEEEFEVDVTAPHHNPS